MISCGASRRCLIVALALVACCLALAVPVASASGQQSVDASSAAGTATGPATGVVDASNETVAVTENASVWERAILPLRADAEAAATVVPAPRVFVNHPSLPQGDLNRDRVAVYDPGTVPLTLSQANGADVSQFAGEEVQVLVAGGALNGTDVPGDGVPDDGLPDDVTPDDGLPDDVTPDDGLPDDVTVPEDGVRTPVENWLASSVQTDALVDLASGQAPSVDDPVGYELTTAQLDSDDGTLEYDFQAAEPGQYAVVVATGEPFAIVDGEPRLTGEPGTVIGAETVVVHERSSAVAAPDAATAGDAVAFDVDTDLTGDSVDHAVTLYHEQTLLYSRTDLVVEDERRIPAAENVSVESSIGAVDGVFRAVGEVPGSDQVPVAGQVTGTLELATALATANELGVPATDAVSVGDQRLDLSSTVVGGAGSETTVAVRTPENASAGTYRYVHVATDRTGTGSVETSTGTIEIGAPGDEGDDDGDEGDGEDGDDGDGDDGDGDEGEDGESDSRGQGDLLCPPTPGVGQAGVSFSIAGQSVASDALRLRAADLPAGARVCGTLRSLSGAGQPDVDFRSLSFSAAESLDLDATVTRTTTAPAAVGPVPTDVGGLAVASVDHGDDLNASVEDVELTVRVDRDRLAADDRVPSDLQFWRFDGEEWATVEHRVGQASDDWLLVVVESPGLSTFAASYSDVDAGEGQTPGSPGAEASAVRTTAASIEQTAVVTGDPVLVTATVDADVSERSEHVAELTVGDETVATESISVDPDGTATVTFEHAFDEAGTYDVAVDGVHAGTVTVEPGATTVPESGNSRNWLPIGVALAAVALVALAVGYRYRSADGGSTPGDSQ